MMTPIQDIVETKDEHELTRQINERLHQIDLNFQTITVGNQSPAARTFQSVGSQPVSPYSYFNPYVDAYEFLDPLYAKLRQSQLLIRQSQMAVNSIGTLQLQLESVDAERVKTRSLTAEQIMAGTITANEIAASTITADRMNVSTLAAITANLGTITAGNITLDSSGFIRGGATTYSSGTGFWVGYDGGAYKLFLGSHTGDYLRWDGTNLSLSGSATIVGSVDWTTSVTNRPLNNDGRVITNATTSAVAGLFLGADYMGYHDGSNWNVFIDNAGNFYLGGLSGALEWDGTALTISGNVYVSGAIITQTGSQIDGAYLAAVSVTTGAIANAAVTGAKIGSLTITASNIANSTITGGKIGLGTITGLNIDSATINGSNIASATITGANIASSTISGSNIAAATITGSNIGVGTITGTNIAAATVQGGNIDTGTITSTNIAAATILAGNIANGTITTTQISATAGITGGQIASATLTAANIANLTITAAQIANLTITAGQIANATVTNGQIASNTITGGASGNLALGTITAANIAAATITASLIAAGTITAVQIASTTITGTQIASMNLTSKTITADTGTIGGWTLSTTTMTGGSVTIDSAGSVKAGQTGYNTGTGWWLGTVSGTPKFSIGTSAGNYLTWDGSSLTIKGAITLTNSISVGSVTGLATVATSGNFADLTGSTKPANNADVTLTAVNGGLTVTGGGITLSSGGSIKGGQTAYNTGTGFFLGYASAAYKFSIGDGTNYYLTWDGSSLNIKGALTLTNTISSASVTGLAAVATSGNFSDIGGATKPSNNADVTLTVINGGLTITGGGLTLSGGGSIKGGQSGYNTGTGFFLGYVSTTYKLSIGDPSGNYVTWDGSTLAIKGAITLTNTISVSSVTGLATVATTGDFANITGATKPSNNADVTLSAINGGLSVTGGGLTLSSGGSIKGGQTGYNTGTGFFLGYTSSAYKFSIGDSSGYYLTWDGTTLSIKGAITLTNTISAGSVSGLASVATTGDFANITGTTKPANNADVTLTAINGGLSVTGGGITLSSGGSIKGGQSGYNTGTGFFLGYSSGYKLSIGNAGSNSLTWDGSTLSISGTITGSDIIVTGALGMRYASDSGVFTITGGSANGVSHGAQIDLAGTSAGGSVDGYLVLSAGNSANGTILLRTGASVDRITISPSGLVTVSGDLKLGSVLRDSGGNQLLTTRRAAVTAPGLTTVSGTGDDTGINANCSGFYTAINDIINRLQSHGLIS